MQNQREAVAAYLARIGYEGPVTATPQVLRAVHYAHIHAVPYENLDIIRGIPVSLEIPALFDKIVTRRRGGYCFELNALLAWLLRAMGFEVTDYFARFLRGETALPKRRHHVLRVETAEGPFLCDVGVGTGVSRVPLHFAEDEPQTFEGETYRLARHADHGWQVEEHYKGEWRAVYCFTEEKQYPVDYVAIHYFCQHAPESVFNKDAMVSLRTATGRNTVAGDEFRVFSGDDVRVWTPGSDAERAEALKTCFGIVL